MEPVELNIRTPKKFFWKYGPLSYTICNLLQMAHIPNIRAMALKPLEENREASLHKGKQI